MTGKIYLPYMCDHNYAIAAAMEAHNLHAVLIPPPDDESLELGLALCRGRECLPCFITTGDILRQIRQSDFDPNRDAIFLVASQGPCRLGQYISLQQEILREQGYDKVHFLAPSSQNSYQGFGRRPIALRLLAWQGIVAIDLLQKLLYQYRPYEINPGQTDAIYQQCLDLVTQAVRHGGGRRLRRTMVEVARKFEHLPVDQGRQRPLIGLVGELYIRLSPFGNQDIIRRVEAAGGEIVLASVMEWLYFTNWFYHLLTWELGHYLKNAVIRLTNIYQMIEEHRLVKPVAHLLRFPYETPLDDIFEDLEPIIDPKIGLEAVLSLGKAMEMSQEGINGILNVMPFSCMPGIITAGMAPRLRADCGQIPWLDVIYDAQGGTNLNTRLEAFMYQAVQHQQLIAT